MMKLILRVLPVAAIAISSMAFQGVSAQTVIEITPLFEYPVAPEELPTLNEKCDYLMAHFWDSMDLKNKTAVDQNALNDAFRVYSLPMRYASKEKVDASVSKLLDAVSKNPALLYQFTKAAEENLYGPRAEVWIDEVYERFLNAAVNSKKIPDGRKDRYRRQLAALTSSRVGQGAPQFSFESRDGITASYFPMSTPTLIIFGDPKDSDWRMMRLRLETNVALTQAVDKGRANVLFIVPEKVDGWQAEVADYPAKWTVGISPEVKESIDIRTKPSVYVIGSDGKTVLKNVSVENGVSALLDILAQ